jgi:anti-sigma factor ChrR (cupin superfamily)
MKEIYTNSGDMDWQPAEGYPPGAERKVLHDGSDSTPLSFLLKMEPGWMMDAHSHVHTEIHYVLDGEYESKDKVYPAGSFRVIPAHTDHGPFTTMRGAVVLVIAIHGL